MSPALSDVLLALAVVLMVAGVAGLCVLALDWYLQRQEAEEFQDREFHPTPQYRPRCAPLQHDWILPPGRAGYCTRCGEPLDLRPKPASGTEATKPEPCFLCGSEETEGQFGWIHCTSCGYSRHNSVSSAADVILTFEAKPDLCQTCGGSGVKDGCFCPTCMVPTKERTWGRA